ncbi:DUF1484 family protein [Pseudomonas sp. Marseille-Q5115]|uniref:DUF1484 family protein n=1 Tax=Pseudomonas sp. Marseille-Q5115 TaxID=2866593 RepID=UPI001CE4786A|nr:DUF1484 family protein [Pseudomonas sp. Marseille-Q5115]
MTAVSLKLLHQGLGRMASSDCHLQRAAGFHHRLEQLSETYQHLDRVTGELAAVSGALELVLQLLDAAHAQPINGDSLHCLLAPLHEKMKRSLSGLEEAL